jgi:hypothetical protein
MKFLRIIISLIILIAVNAPLMIAQESDQQQSTDPSQERRPRRQSGQTPDGQPRERPDGQPPRRQTPQNEPRLRERMMVLEIDARLMGQNETVIWSESHLKETLLGRPVGIKLVGNNLIVDVQVTPYFRPGTRYFLVAQAQIWMEIPNQGVRYYTTMQTIPVEFGDPVYFFPLGSRSEGDGDDSRIEIRLTLQRQEEN